MIVELKNFRTRDGSSYAIVFHDEENALISDTWLGDFHDDDEFRQVLEFVADEIEARAVKLWLADLRHLTRSFFEFQDWLAHEISPRTFAAGLQREAVVLPPPAKLDSMPQDYDVVGSAAGAIDQIGDRRVRFFFDRDAAHRWLLSGDGQ
ncbi:MAG: hypothetical protein RIM72_09265 [Alphaproteobacteria bacterium]